MAVTVNEHINAPRDRVWGIVTDADSWADNISGITSVEVLEKPETGIVGLKWKEKRVFFGKEATETMWVTAAEPGRWYETKAENHGAIYTTRVSLDDASGGTDLTMQFSAKPTTVAARLMTLMSFMLNASIRKALKQDLSDIRQVAEQR